MNNQLKPRLDLLISDLNRDLALIAKKKKDDEWKRDHYRYTFTIHVQRIYEMLNTPITDIVPSEIKSSTKKEMIFLRDYLNTMLKD